MSLCLSACKCHTLKTLLIGSSHCLLSSARFFNTIEERGGPMEPYSTSRAANHLEEVYSTYSRSWLTSKCSMGAGCTGGCGRFSRSWQRGQRLGAQLTEVFEHTQSKAWGCAKQGRRQKDRRVWGRQKEREEGQNKTSAIIWGEGHYRSKLLRLKN